MKCVDLTSWVLNDKRALGGKEGSADTDKGIIVMTSCSNLKLKISPHHSFYSYRYFSEAYYERSSYGFI